MSIEHSVAPSLGAFRSAADHALSRDRTLSVEGSKVEASDRSLAGKKLAMIRGFPDELKQSAVTFQAFKQALAETYGDKIAAATVNEMQRQTGGVFVAKHVQQGLSLADGIVKHLRTEPSVNTSAPKQATAHSTSETLTSALQARVQTAETKYERGHFQSTASFASLIKLNIDETPGIYEQPKGTLKERIQELLRGRNPENLTVAEKTQLFELEAQLREKTSNR